MLGYEKLHDEPGRAMHKSWGNAIWFDDAVEKMGADVMRWLFAGQDTGQNMNFGYGPANEVARRLLTLWNTYRFLVLNAEPEGFRPLWDEADRGPESDNPLDRWIVARAPSSRATARAALDAYDTPSMTRAVEAFWDDLSNWYVRRSRARFWEGDRAGASRRSTTRSCSAARDRAGDAVPGRGDVGEPGARGCGPDAPASVHLAGYPGARRGAHRDAACSWPMADVRAVSELGHRARAGGQAARAPAAGLGGRRLRDARAPARRSRPSAPRSRAS